MRLIHLLAAGLNVTLLKGGPHINPTEKVLTAEAGLGIGTSGRLVTRSRGKPVVAVAAIFQHSPYILITRDDPSIRTLEDLEGRTIMVEPYSEELEAYLYHEGVDSNAIKRTEHSGNPLDIFGGKIVGTTAYTTTEPFVLDRHGKPYRVFDPKVAGIDFYGDTLYTSEAFANEHNDEVVALRDAVIEGWRYAMRHPEQLVELIERRYAPRDSRELLRFQARDTRRLWAPLHRRTRPRPCRSGFSREQQLIDIRTAPSPQTHHMPGSYRPIPVSRELF